MTKPTLNLEQAASAAHVCRRSLYYWMRQGHLPYVLVHGHRRVVLSDVLAARDRACELSGLDGPSLGTSAAPAEGDVCRRAAQHSGAA